MWRPPHPIATPDAVTTIGHKVIVHGAGIQNEEEMQWMKPNDPWVREMIGSGLRHEHIVEWVPGAETWQVIGEWPSPVTEAHLSLRGLPGGRFIAPKPDGYTILAFD